MGKSGSGSIVISTSSHLVQCSFEKHGIDMDAAILALLNDRAVMAKTECRANRPVAATNAVRSKNLENLCSRLAPDEIGKTSAVRSDYNCSLAE
jgi:hypothetical protein